MNYEILRWGDLQISEAAIWINLNTPDPVDRELYQEVRFRRALSVAINRQRVNDTLVLWAGPGDRRDAATGRIALLQGRICAAPTPTMIRIKPMRNAG